MLESQYLSRNGQFSVVGVHWIFTRPIIRCLFGLGEGERNGAFQLAQAVVSYPGLLPDAAVHPSRWLCGDTIQPGIGHRYQGSDADGHAGQNYGGGTE